MEITEVRIKLTQDPSERLQAFCSITFDHAFVIRDLKIIDGTSGPFVAMPSRKLTTHCPQCGGKNHLRAAYCNQCGQRLSADRPVREEEGRAKLYADIAHPINSACRELISSRVIAAFREEQERSRQPGYVPRYEDLDQDVESVCLAAQAVEAAAPAVAVDRPPPPRVAAAVRTNVQPAERPSGPHRGPARVAALSASAPVATAAAQHAGGPHIRQAKAPSEPFGAGVFD
jgi:stage V sporulation protein G